MCVRECGSLCVKSNDSLRAVVCVRDSKSFKLFGIVLWHSSFAGVQHTASVPPLDCNR